MTAPIIVTTPEELAALVRQAVAEALAALQPAPVVVTDEPAYYTVTEAAACLRVDPNTIYKAVAAGEITKTPIGRGREYRISREALHTYARNQEGAK